MRVITNLSELSRKEALSIASLFISDPSLVTFAKATVPETLRMKVV